MVTATTMDRIPSELAEELFRSLPQASVLEITRWVQQQTGVADPDFIREVIIAYWTRQQQSQKLRNGSSDF
jgi:hypothetical protein